MPATQTSAAMLTELRQRADPVKAAFLPGFFQAYPGGYGAGDKFLGVVVPEQRAVAKLFSDMTFAELDKGLRSPWHEMRTTCLFVLVKLFERSLSTPKRGIAPKCTTQEVVDFYLARLAYVNNWDLVDSSAPQILGRYVLVNRTERKVLHALSRSQVLWEQRIAIVANMPLVKAGEFDDLLKISLRMLTHSHDLIHKATGWLLRELGKVDIEVLTAFLNAHGPQMPRTMLRYSIERYPESERKAFLARECK